MTRRTLKRIMLVEDEPDIRAVAKLALEALGGYTVELCASGDEALAKVAEFAPDLLLLDVMMPGLDGPNTYRALRLLPQAESTPIVFMTAKVQRHEVERYRQMGAVDVIAKPFDPMTLSGTIDKIWENVP